MRPYSSRVYRALLIAGAAGFVLSSALILFAENARLTQARQEALDNRVQLIDARLDNLLGEIKAFAKFAEQKIDAVPSSVGAEGGKIDAETRRVLAEKLAETPLSAMSAYTASGDQIFEIGESKAASVRTQSFVPPADHVIADAPDARVAVLGLTKAGGQQALALSVVLSAPDHGSAVRGFDVAVPIDLIRPWLAKSETLPQPIDLGFALPGAPAWYLEDGSGKGPHVNPASIMTGSAEDADHPLGVVLRTARPNLGEVLLAAWPMWFLMLGPALALIGAVVLRSRFRWVRLERQVAESEADLEFNVAALDLAEVGVVHWNLGAAKISFSTTWRRLLGYEGDEFCDEITEWLDRIHPEDRDRCAATYQALLDGVDQEFAHEVRVLSRAGSYILFLERGVREPCSDTILVTLERARVKQERRSEQRTLQF